MRVLYTAEHILTDIGLRAYTIPRKVADFVLTCICNVSRNKKVFMIDLQAAEGSFAMALFLFVADEGIPSSLP